MPVVINEFEVVAEPPPATRGGGDGAQPAAAAGGVTARDLERVLRQRRDRLLRVWSH